MNPVHRVFFRIRSSGSPNISALSNNILKKAYSSGEEIVIPKRIHRGPTDILRALASTVQRDYTAPHYTYHDDPYLIPTSNVRKRSYALAKESGRKSARWIREQNAEFFKYQNSDPPIEAFFPCTVYDENSEVSEETLYKVMDDTSVSDAIKVYELLGKKDIVLSDAAKQAFLEFLCYFNCEDTLSEEWIEEKWFRQNMRNVERAKKTWKDNGLAEKIFQSIENKDSSSYCTMMLGMLRFYQVDRAWKLYEEALDKRIPLSTATFNSLIRVTTYLRESDDLRLKLLEEFMHEMVKQDLKPNIGTLNSILEVLSAITNRTARVQSLRVLSEFKYLGIEPSLASYYHLLLIFYKKNTAPSSILVDIMDYIENKTFTIQDLRDVEFFTSAMSVCSNNLVDKDLAKRIDKLLHTGENYNLIGDCYKESIYYKHYFILLCETEPLDVFMQFYNKIVPHVYIPEVTVMVKVIDAVNLNAATQYFPKIWSDIIIFGLSDHERVVNVFLDALVKHSNPENKETSEQFTKIATELLVNNTGDEERHNVLSFTGEMLGKLLILLVHGNEFEKACSIVKRLDEEAHKIVGVPEVRALQEFLNLCIQNKNVKYGLICIKYCSDACFLESTKMSEQLGSELQLSETELAHLKYIVGHLSSSPAGEEQKENVVATEAQ